MEFQGFADCVVKPLQSQVHCYGKACQGAIIMNQSLNKLLKRDTSAVYGDNQGTLHLV